MVHHGRRCIERVVSDVFCTRSFIVALCVATLAGSSSIGFFLLDESMDSKFAEFWVPDSAVFSVFLGFTSLVVAFRTTNALNRYTDAARHLHRLSAVWFDAGSTLLAFCRVSVAPTDDIQLFQNVTVRLISTLNAFCLESLQNNGKIAMTAADRNRFRFEILGSSELDEETQRMILSSEHKVECVFQMIQNLVVDAQKSGVLSIAPPILTRSFQELGAGLVAYHEAKKLACVPLPFAYKALTATILVCAAAYLPVMMAMLSKGPTSSFLLSFVGTFLLWFMNGVADALDNPFRKEARSLDAEGMQRELNAHLTQLLEQTQSPPPRLNDQVWAPTDQRDGDEPRKRPSTLRSMSLNTWSRGAPSNCMGALSPAPGAQRIRPSMMFWMDSPRSPSRRPWSARGQEPARSAGGGAPAAFPREAAAAGGEPHGGAELHRGLVGGRVQSSSSCPATRRHRDGAGACKEAALYRDSVGACREPALPCPGPFVRKTTTTSSLASQVVPEDEPWEEDSSDRDNYRSIDHNDDLERVVV